MDMVILINIETTYNVVLATFYAIPINFIAL